MNHYCILYCSLVDLFASLPSTNSLPCYIEEQAQALAGMITPIVILLSPKIDAQVEYLFDIEAEEVSVEGVEVSYVVMRALVAQMQEAVVHVPLGVVVIIHQSESVA